MKNNVYINQVLENFILTLHNLFFFNLMSIIFQ